ncbi:hypothetical protein CspeluHIS016_0305920 [Cutaneotrichosporon spelunceum]|uniref:F-box domain-containing protein n=1 Tax=Cutaneotrichosporon spelunceum TaxID=1672016 RepID=A0AAD3YCA4_9TREE|nr:hypothetical protein CspeluHIS016_0305920 [Cutaneotrichosporon spelunceum]
MPTKAVSPPKKRKKWSLAAFCIGEVPEHVQTQTRRPSLILETRPYTPPASLRKTVSTSPVLSKFPTRVSTIRFQDPLPVPRIMKTPCKDILIRIAFFCDSQNLRKLRRVNHEFRSIAEGILLRHVAAHRSGIRIFPPPGGTRSWASFADNTAEDVPGGTAPRPSAKETALVTVNEVSADDGEALSLWKTGRHNEHEEDEEDEDAPWSESDTDAESDDESVCSNEPSSYSSVVAAASKGLHLPPAANATFILPTRSRLLRKIRIVDIHPEADAKVLRRMISVPPPIGRALPGASGTFTNDTVIVFSHTGDSQPPAYPRPALTTSSARTVITNLLDADGTEGLGGLSCGTERTVILISPAVARAKKEESVDAADDEAEVTTLVDSSGARSLCPETARVASPEQPRPDVEDTNRRRLLENLTSHIARLLPESTSAWTIVGAESWPAEWVNVAEDGRGVQDALRALVAGKFPHWADDDSSGRLRFVSRADWAREVGHELSTLASEV